MLLKNSAHTVDANLQKHTDATVAAETKQSTQYAMAELGKLQDPGGPAKLVRKYSAYTLLAIDEWLVDKPDERFRRFLLELMELRYDNASTAFATQSATKEWHSRLGGDTIEIGRASCRERV